MATGTAEKTVDPAAQAALKEAMAAQSLAPLWEIYTNLVTPEPNAAVPSHLWKWSEMDKAIRLASETVHGHDADHRVLLLKNPHMPQRMTSITNIIGAVQCVLPGEKTTPHRHTPSAVRLVLEGTGGATFVDGQRCDMHTGDFIVTPNWTWHCHDNDSAERAVWVDILDVPFVKSLDAVFGELGPANAYPETLATLPDRVWEQGGLTPVCDRPGVPYTTRFRYGWPEVAALLDEIPAAADGSRTLRYGRPLDGGPVTATLDAYVTQIEKGKPTRAARSTASALCVVVEGEGRSEVGDQAHDWRARDIFTIPEWSWVTHSASSAKARLLMVTDREVLSRLGLLREQQG